LQPAWYGTSVRNTREAGKSNEGRYREGRQGMAAGEPSPSSDDGSITVTPDDVRAALERTVASPDFVASERARRFLRYVVEETLAGRSERIKAFSVAVEVFGRDESFDPQNDPVVRIEAGRLRRALERYYLLAGKDDPVFIDIPKGGYVPTFSARESPAPTLAPDTAVVPTDAAATTPGAPSGGAGARRQGYIAAALLILVLAIAGAWVALVARPFDQAVLAAPPGGPRILVLPFTDLGGSPLSGLYAEAMTDEVITALGHFKEISVLGLQTSRSLPADPSLATLNEEFGLQYVLEGSVRAGDDDVRVSARVTSSTTGAVLWSRAYDYPASPDDLFTLPTLTAGEVAAAVAQPYGIVFQAETARERQSPPDNLDAYVCTLKFYVYRAAISPEKYGEVRRCLEDAVARFPEYATAWALLAYMYIDEIRTGFGTGDTSPVERALAAARTAVRLDPDNVRALQALATALFFNHDLDEAFAMGDRALALNPNDTELLGQFGLLKGQSGRFDEGRALIERALTLNPGHSGFYRGGLAIIAYMQGDYATALREIEQSGQGRLPIFHGVAAIVYARNGLHDRARDELDIFNQMAPSFVPNLWAELDSRNIPPASQIDIAADLESLGATLPPRPEPHGGSASGPL
jgi:adenylate cyclase